MRKNKSYDLDQCALYKCQTKKKLFKIIQTTPAKYAELKVATDLYKPLKKKKKDGTFREVKAPRGDLKRIQKRISELLMRVKAPDYLKSPVRGISNIDNAAQHRGKKAFHLLDVEDFYPSCTAKKLVWFFEKVLKCSPDVAAILVRLTALDGVLPAGSPASPPLAFWAYKDMWDEIHALANEGGCDVSVYVDDITISGERVSGSLIYAIKQCLIHHGHNYKKSKEVAQIHSPVVVTGVVVRGQKLLMPNVQQQERHLLRKEIERLPDGREKSEKELSLAGRDQTELQILARNESA